MADGGRSYDHDSQPLNAQRLLELYDRVADAPDAVERLSLEQTFHARMWDRCDD